MEWLADFIVWLSTVGTDTIMVGIAKNNIIVGGLIIAVISAIIKRTKTTLDDDILEMFKGRKRVK